VKLEKGLARQLTYRKGLQNPRRVPFQTNIIGVWGKQHDPRKTFTVGEHAIREGFSRDGSALHNGVASIQTRCESETVSSD